MFLVFLSKVFLVYSYEELATIRPRISTDRSQIAVLTPIGSPDVCTSVDSCLGHDTSPWCQVDLGGNHQIAAVNIYHRTDNAQGRLVGAAVSASATPDFHTTGQVCETLDEAGG